MEPVLRQSSTEEANPYSVPTDLYSDEEENGDVRVSSNKKVKGKYENMPTTSADKHQYEKIRDAHCNLPFCDHTSCPGAYNSNTSGEYAMIPEPKYGNLPCDNPSCDHKTCSTSAMRAQIETDRLNAEDNEPAYAEIHDDAVEHDDDDGRYATIPEMRALAVKSTCTLPFCDHTACTESEYELLPGDRECIQEQASVQRQRSQLGPLSKTALERTMVTSPTSVTRGQSLRPSVPSTARPISAVAPMQDDRHANYQELDAVFSQFTAEFSPRPLTASPAQDPCRKIKHYRAIGMMSYTHSAHAMYVPATIARRLSSTGPSTDDKPVGLSVW